MKEWLTLVAGSAVTIAHAMALIIVAIGMIEAFIGSMKALFRPSVVLQFHSTYARFARALVGGLTFQLAADIIESSIAPSWDEIGRLGAIALIRTFLNYFLERDLAQLERHDHER